MARKLRKIKAEEEIKEKEELELKKDDKDLKVEDKVEEESTDKVKEKTKEVEEAPEAKDLIVLSDGSTVEEEVELSEEEAKDLAKITKQDGTEIFVEKVEGDEAEKKEVYEAILEAEKPEDEVAEELEDEVNTPEFAEEIEEVAYVPAACHTAHASLNNSYYILKLKGGKLKALKAGKILNKELKASIIKAHLAGKKLPEAETVFNKIASKIGFTLGAFHKLASKLSGKVRKVANMFTPKVGDTVDMGDGKEVRIISRKAGLLTLANGKKVLAKHLRAAELPDTVPGTKNEDAQLLKNFAIDESDIKKSKYESEVALEGKEFKKADEDAGVKAAPSKVKSLYNRLPSKSEVGDEVEWSLKDFNKERNKQDKTLASQIKALRDATKEVRAQKEALADKDAEIKSLQEKIASYNRKEETILKGAKINKILASMNIEDDEEKAAMTEKFAKYTKAQLDAVYETLTACPSEEATIMHERMINDEMKKEASELKGFVPSFNLEESLNSSDDMEKLVLERELDSINK